MKPADTQASAAQDAHTIRSGVMHTVRIEHRIHDFVTWKAAFDRDPARRQESGVHHYRVSRRISDPNFIVIELDFDTADAAEAFLATMRTVWTAPQATAVIRGSPHAEIVEMVEHKEF
jgi:quinol monooxygenase YgiN